MTVNETQLDYRVLTEIAHLRGTVDRVVTDHDRRLDTQDNINASTAVTIGALSSTVAEHGVSINGLTEDVEDIRMRQSGALAKVMAVLSPLIALGSLVLAFTLSVTGG